MIRETQKLYYEDALLREFTATVLSCEPSAKGYAVVLDRTAFYPEGGGQPADRGTLGEAQISDVHEKEGVILHTADRPLEPGTTVAGCIDWERRFDHMQQHSGEHIVSGMICSRFSCDNVGFHMGADSVLIDYNAPVTAEELQEIERDANRYIWEDHPFEVLWPTAEERKTIDYRSKKELTGAVRITRFPGADCCACCGTHVPRSGMVGLVKFLSVQKFHDGVRIELLCGKRAFDHLSMNRDCNLAVSRSLSAKLPETPAAVERMSAELAAEKLRANINEEKLLELSARAFEGKGNTVTVTGPLSPDGTRKYCDLLSKACGGDAAVFSGEDGAYRYAVLLRDGSAFRDTVKEINTVLRGRGGGRDGLAQGNVSCSEEEIRALFSRIF